MPVPCRGPEPPLCTDEGEVIRMQNIVNTVTYLTSEGNSCVHMLYSDHTLTIQEAAEALRARLHNDDPSPLLSVEEVLRVESEPTPESLKWRDRQQAPLLAVGEKHEVLEQVLDHAKKIEDLLYVFTEAIMAQRLNLNPAHGRYPFRIFTDVVGTILRAIDPTILDGLDLEDKLSDAIPTAQPEYRFPPGHRTLLRYRAGEKAIYTTGPGEEMGVGCGRVSL